MSRETKRVAMDFDWPLSQGWSGYLMPDELDIPGCATCDGRGDTKSRRAFERIVSLLMLGGDDSLRGRLHPYWDSTPIAHIGVGDSLHEVTAGLAGRMPSGLGHDSSDGWRATAKIIEAAGLPKDWGYCPTCAGSGEAVVSDEHRAAHEGWTKTEPPAGEGWQMWESVSEGSPISPVFETPEELARWLADTGAYAGGVGPGHASYETWLRMIHAGWAPSMVSVGGGVMSGVEYVGRAEDEVTP